MAIAVNITSLSGAPRIVRPVPTGLERTLGVEEMIVTKTDLKGIITYANDVFLSISAYSEDQVIGQPHNMIRHPEMPSAIFAVLWETISAGEEVFAYTMNLAGDGAHYWVLAHVTPSRDASGRIVGYHSNRRHPDRAALRTIEPWYARLRAAERQHGSGRDGLAASRAMLATDITAAGGYDPFVWSLINGSDLSGSSDARNRR